MSRYSDFGGDNRRLLYPCACVRGNNNIIVTVMQPCSEGGGIAHVQEFHVDRVTEPFH